MSCAMSRETGSVIGSEISCEMRYETGHKTWCKIDGETSQQMEWETGRKLERKPAVACGVQYLARKEDVDGRG